MGRGRHGVQVRSLRRSTCSHTLTPRFCRPERWQQPPEAISAIPGVWGHLLTFIGGPRACIGYRFSIIEYVLLTRLRSRLEN